MSTIITIFTTTSTATPTSYTEKIDGYCVLHRIFHRWKHRRRNSIILESAGNSMAGYFIAYFDVTRITKESG
jgi:hypothetical protein